VGDATDRRKREIQMTQRAYLLVNDSSKAASIILTSQQRNDLVSRIVTAMIDSYAIGYAAGRADATWTPPAEDQPEPAP
jgi:hypothetical protein